MSFTDDYAARVVKNSEDRGEFLMLEDGFCYYWPNPNNKGAMSSLDLRILSEELDRRNREWNDKLQKAFPAEREITWYSVLRIAAILVAIAGIIWALSHV